MKIILKVDDFWGPTKRFSDFFKLIADLNIKICLGIVGKGAVKMTPEQCAEIIGLNKNIEIFNHSWAHIISDEIKEFWHTDVYYQAYSLRVTNKIIKEKFGVDCEVVGFPANAFSENTLEILSKFPDIKRVFYLKGWNHYDELSALKKIIDINSNGAIETDMKVDVNRLKGAFESGVFSDKEVITFQLHPSAWSEQSFGEFKSCLDFLIALGAEFIFTNQL